MSKDNEKTLTQEEALALKEELELARKQAEAQKAEAEKLAETLGTMQAETEAAKAEAEAAKEALAQANAEAGENTEASDAAEEERVPYVLPRNILSDAKHHTVNLNGVNYQIQTGVTVMVPKGVAEILDNALEQRQAANELQDELSVEE